ncbi:outer arm dynein light chain 1 [Neurospora tetraspora]|uniref:Outer arm dynein light chain 1 n=1 Tax=Neurospora tetraspora TaxID=94610 RepID=A0AAE0MTQ7_9PEZI|nr:outer arm dynein light chain 1 [Neurospora tetraspora]
MHDLETLNTGGYASTTHLKLTCPLPSGLPPAILTLGATLTHLDLSSTGLSSLPSEFGTSLPNLRILFLSSNNFTTFPSVLAECPSLEMVAFRSNGMTTIPEGSLPKNLRWLILTDNQISTLPEDLGKCERLEKCMLSGNRLSSLPESMATGCKNLALLRLSANRFESIPEWLFNLPKLAFLSFAGNPCVKEQTSAATAKAGKRFDLERIEWKNLQVQETLGEGASGVISRGLWKQSEEYAEEVAIKVFKGGVTSDGTPKDEMAAVLAAGFHEGLITVLGRVVGHPDEVVEGGEGGAAEGEEEKKKFQGGIVMQLIPEYYSALGLPPSFDTCSRDCFPEDASLSAAEALGMLTGIAGAAAHLHQRGIAHGDLYAHNILASKADRHALLGDFGAATIYGTDEDIYAGMEKLEVLAFAHLLEDVLGLIRREKEKKSTQTPEAKMAIEVADAAPPAFRDSSELTEEEEEAIAQGLEKLQLQCADPQVNSRPSFEDIAVELEDLVGFRGMMRIPIPNLN